MTYLRCFAVNDCMTSLRYPAVYCQYGILRAAAPWRLTVSSIQIQYTDTAGFRLQIIWIMWLCWGLCCCGGVIMGVFLWEMCVWKRAEDDWRDKRVAGLGYVDRRGSECQTEGQKKHRTFPKWPLYFLLHKIHTGFAISRFVFILISKKCVLTLRSRVRIGQHSGSCFTKNLEYKHTI